MKFGYPHFGRLPQLVLGIGAALGLALVGLGQVANADYFVIKGVGSGSGAVSYDGYCPSVQYPYDWWHSLAYSVNTNTTTRQMTVSYLDYYGGDTNPDPPYTVPPAIEHVWDGDSWLFGTSSFRFGNTSAFNGQQFDSYDITLWLNHTMGYSPNGYITVETRFGEQYYTGTNINCRGTSYVYLDPPN